MAIRKVDDYTVRPAEPYKKYITPSSLYKGNCARCTWMSYWHNFQIPVNMALQQHQSRLQEKSYDGVETQKISPELPEGWTTLYKGKFASRPISINGIETRWKLYGELDFLSENKDGTYSIIDGKVSMKHDEAELIGSYWTQLEAYVFMLENPESGDSKKISSIGLLQWRIDAAIDMANPIHGFSVEERYIPVKRNPKAFQEYMERFIGYIEGQFPKASTECRDCDFLSTIGFYKD